MYDVIIIGSGPAGYTAALYTSRAFLKTLLLTGADIGGQLTMTTTVDNFPGFPAGTPGPLLVENMKKQALKFGTDMKTEQALHCSVVALLENQKKGKSFEVKTNTQKYYARSLIIATGSSARNLGILSEEKFRGKGVSYCATCDGFFFKGKTIAVIGGGDTAMEEATFLTRFATHVTIIHRRDTFRASAIMLEKAKNNPAISLLLNKTIEGFYGDTILRGIKLKDTISEDVTDFPIEGVFIAIGHLPNTAFLKGFLDLDEKGYIQIQRCPTSLDSQTETTIPGVFAAGDCVDPRYRQAIVASGMGCMAAIDAQKWLDEQKNTYFNE